MGTSNGYTYFFKQASIYDSECGNFADACHKLPEDDYDESSSDQPCQSHDKPRESHDNTREVY